MAQIFVIEKYGNRKEFTIGQKVECIYYHEYPDEKCAYKRSLLSKLIDRPFRPVKLGVIVGDAGVHPYWLASNREQREQYLFVKFKQYVFAKPIPISCITDALQAAKRMEKFLQHGMDNLGSKGFSYESYNRLKKQMNKALEYVETTN